MDQLGVSSVAYELGVSAGWRVVEVNGAPVPASYSGAMLEQALGQAWAAGPVRILFELPGGRGRNEGAQSSKARRASIGGGELGGELRGGELGDFDPSALDKKSLLEAIRSIRSRQAEGADARQHVDGVGDAAAEGEHGEIDTR